MTSCTGWTATPPTQEGSPPTEEELDRLTKDDGWFHVFLDALGLAPVVGDLIDLIHGAIYLAEGKKTDALLSLGAAIAIIGTPVLKGGKYTFKLISHIDEASEIADLSFKSVKVDEGFKTWKSLRSSLGQLGDDHVWHHIVEQSMQKRGRFGAEMIQNPGNVIGLSKGMHKRIAACYSSKRAFTGGLRFETGCSPSRSNDNMISGFA
jgi:hypothetical protein